MISLDGHRVDCAHEAVEKLHNTAVLGNNGLQLLVSTFHAVVGGGK